MPTIKSKMYLFPFFGLGLGLFLALLFVLFFPEIIWNKSILKTTGNLTVIINSVNDSVNIYPTDLQTKQPSYIKTSKS